MCIQLRLITQLEGPRNKVQLLLAVLSSCFRRCIQRCSPGKPHWNSISERRGVRDRSPDPATIADWERPAVSIGSQHFYHLACKLQIFVSPAAADYSPTDLRAGMLLALEIPKRADMPPFFLNSRVQVPYTTYGIGIKTRKLSLSNQMGMCLCVYESVRWCRSFCGLRFR